MAVIFTYVSTWSFQLSWQHCENSQNDWEFKKCLRTKLYMYIIFNPGIIFIILFCGRISYLTRVLLNLVNINSPE